MFILTVLSLRVRVIFFLLKMRILRLGDVNGLLKVTQSRPSSQKGFPIPNPGFFPLEPSCGAFYVSYVFFSPKKSYFGQAFKPVFLKN